MSPAVVRVASRVELALLLREPITLVFALALPIVYLVVLAGVFGDTPDPSGEVFRGVGGATYYTPAYVGLCAASVGLISIPAQLAGYREHGVLRRMRSAGLSVSAVLGAQAAVGALLATASGLLVYAVARVAYHPAAAVDPVGVVVAFAVGTLAFASVGLLLGSLMPTARSAQGGGVLVWFVVLMVGGAGPPPEVLPDAMRTLGDLTPLHPLVVALQDPWFGNGWNVPALLVLAAIGTACTGVAALRLRRD